MLSYLKRYRGKKIECGNGGAKSKKITLSLEDDVYEGLQEFPRRVSLSEVASWVIRAAFEDIKAGRELNSKELQDWIDSTPEGKDFRERFVEQWGPGIKKIDETVEKVKKAVYIKKGKKSELRFRH